MEDPLSYSFEEVSHFHFNTTVLENRRHWAAKLPVMEPEGLSADDLACPICMDRLTDPFVTACGHSFCYSCITTHLSHRSSCPSCSNYLIADKVFPNYLLSKVVTKAAVGVPRKNRGLIEQLQAAIESAEDGLQLADLETLLGTLEDRKIDLQQKEKEKSLQLLLHFLNHSRVSKERKFQELQEELQILNTDIHHVETRQNSLPSTAAGILALLSNVSRSPSSHANIVSEGSLAEKAPSLAELLASSGVREQQHLRLQVPAALPEPSLMLQAPTPSGNMDPRCTDERGTRQPLAMTARASFPNWTAASSSLFHPDGQHLSTRALGLDQLAGNGAGILPAQEPAVSSVQLTSSSWHTSSDPAARSSDASLLQRPQISSPALGPGAQEQPGREPESRQLSRFHGQGRGMAQSAGPVSHSSQLRSDDPSSGRASQEAASLASSLSGAGADDDPRQSFLSLTGHKRPAENQFEELQQHYLRMRHRQLQGARQQSTESEEPSPLGLSKPVQAEGRPGSLAELAGQQDGAGPSPRPNGGAVGASDTTDRNDLHHFSRMLSMFTNTCKLKLLAAVPGASQRTSAAILSGIAFDKPARLFATAGVSKRISIFDYEHLIGEAAQNVDRLADISPATELVTRSKLSCLSWNWFQHAQLSSSDYEGVITVWDSQAGQPVTEFEAHDKRIWSLDHCPCDPHLLASGSDDGFVKVWSTQQNKSVAELDLKANVCCVKYSPESQHSLAVGSADHSVHLYDLRNCSRPVCVFTGHRKAVSYVRFISQQEVVSASTDSTLRLWDVRQQSAGLTYSGHVNEKNFVGLSLSSDFIACGSETSEVFVYYRSMSKPVTRRLFAPPLPLPSNSTGSGPSSGSRQNLQFISAVCWKPNSQTLLAANSQGAIKVFQLTT